ncbi:hypothetical protein B0F90DRAFT_1334880 [Multifurca ochricompacta]|uniref:Calcium-dependent phosphotriesterase n=1 Tax=Multifurca ochricompacta TaxID=376703 RepID=A0AAD4QMH9_9AGAM|nr:hypothetical protein B0F90DRAFT_1334880 [Multifurca ochricompacta]
MKSSLSWAVATALLGFLLWRNGQTARTILIPTPDFPHGYYAEASHSEHCTSVKDTPSNGMRYCEDAAFWERVDSGGTIIGKVLLLSCDPNRKAWNTVMGPLSDPTPRGALWFYDIQDIEARPRQVTLEGYPEGHDFHPLGFDIYPSQPNQPHSNLFVVNHARNSSTIEQFVMSWDTPDRAQWVRTLSGPELVAPNALALTSQTSFYLTHDHRFTRRLPGVLGKTLPIIESTLALPLGWATHVTIPTTSTQSESQSATHITIASRIPFANGIAISPDGAQVAIASTTLCEVLFYSRDINTQALSLHGRVPTPFAPDNIIFDSSGSLIVAGHPHFQALVAVAANRTAARAPSWVVSITPTLIGAEAGVNQGQKEDSSRWDLDAPVPASRKVRGVLGYELRTLYQSDGSAFSAASTALRDAETGVVYIVGLYEDGLMVCSP